MPLPQLIYIDQAKDVQGHRQEAFKGPYTLMKENNPRGEPQSRGLYTENGPRK